MIDIYEVVKDNKLLETAHTLYYESKIACDIDRSEYLHIIEKMKTQEFAQMLKDCRKLFLALYCNSDKKVLFRSHKYSHHKIKLKKLRIVSRIVEEFI